MTPAGAVPRLHLVTSTDLLADPDFEARAGTVLEALAERRSAQAVASPSASSTPPASRAAPRLALHLRGRLPARRLLELAAALHPRAGAAGAELWVSDRADVARIAGLEGLQLPSAGFDVATARALLPRNTRIGASVHDSAQARAASDADLWVAGNVWETSSHPGRPAAGTELLRALTTSPGARPVVAIGGVTPERVGAALAAGAYGVAVLSGIWSDPSPPDAAIRYLEALTEPIEGDPA